MAEELKPLENFTVIVDPDRYRTFLIEDEEREDEALDQAYADAINAALDNSLILMSFVQNIVAASDAGDYGSLMNAIGEAKSAISGG